MADISKELKAWKEAVYGEEVRDAQVELSNKLNAEVEAATETVKDYEAAETKRVIAESARVEAENKRQADTTAAIESTDEATGRANVAAEAAERYVLGDISNKTVAFTEASERANINPDESTATLFGKIKKFFADLKNVAFTGNASDVNYNNSTSGLSAANVQSAVDEQNSKLKGIETGANKTTIANNLTTTTAGSALDATQGRALNNKIAALPIIQAGSISITPTAANTATYGAVTFPEAFPGTPRVCVTPYNAAVGDSLTGWGVQNASKAGFDAVLRRTNTTSATLHWIAVYIP